MVTILIFLFLIVSPAKRQQSMLRERGRSVPIDSQKVSKQSQKHKSSYRPNSEGAVRPATQDFNVRPKCYNKPWRQDSGPLRIARIHSTDKAPGMKMC